jgi:hypothetical protein
MLGALSAVLILMAGAAILVDVVHGPSPTSFLYADLTVPR